MSTASALPRSRRMVAVTVLVPLLAALALWAFTWPAARLAPQDLPLGVAGPTAAASAVQDRLEENGGAFDVRRYADEAAARAAVEDRAVYGAVVVTERGPKLLTASAASPVVDRLLRQAVTAQSPGGTPVRTVDVVPAPDGDPRGIALGSSVLPMTLAGVAAGALVAMTGLRRLRAAIALVGAAVLVGLVAAALAHSWLGVLTGDCWTEAGALSLTVLAVGAAVAGLAALIGPAGIGVGALLVVLLGNPFSGVTSAPELLPQPVGLIGQWLPPGAGGSLLRSVSFFDGAQAGGPALVLGLWTALGLTAVLLGGRRAAGGGVAAGEPQAVPEPAPAD
ncbi:ABC transporter permease [Streptomyces sp. O3]